MINKEEISAGNKLIGGFMELNQGWAYHESEDEGYGVTKYNSSWDWSMPVADKINGLGKEFSLAIFKNYVSLTVEKGGKVYKDFSFAHAEYITAEQTGKEAMFKLLVKFIKWYNENILNNNLEKTQDGNNIR